MKTRSNMPLFVVECEDVKALSNSQIDLLRCGDYLVKKDESGEHAYKVTFKSDTGVCITYHDASVIETQSYDKVGQNWVYNSEDKSKLPINEEDASFKPVYCHPLTMRVSFTYGGLSYTAELCALIFNNSSASIDTKQKLFDAIDAFGTIAETSKVLLVSGGVASSGEGAFYMSARSLTMNNENKSVFIEGVDNTGTRHTTGSNVINVTNETWNYVYDAVNKIN